MRHIVPIAVLCAAFVLAPFACSSGSREVAVRKDFWLYDRVAIWSNLAREEEELFIPLYMKAFPHQTLVERRDINAVLGEQDILPDRLNESTRARLREVLGVKAIVYPTRGAGQMAIKVIDTETGAISASAIVRAGGADGGSAEKMMRQLIDGIQDHGYKPDVKTAAASD